MIKYRSYSRDQDFGSRRALLYVFLLLSIVCGGLLTTAGAIIAGLFQISWIYFLPLLLIIRLARPTAACLFGTFWGIGLCIMSAPAYSSLSSGNIATISLVVIVPACYALFGARMTRAIGFAPFVLAVGWILVELALQPVLTGPSLFLGRPIAEFWMRYVGGLLGYVFITFIIVYINARLITLVDMVSCFIIRSQKNPIAARPCGRIILFIQSLNQPPRTFLFHPRAPPFGHCVIWALQ